MKTTIMLAEFLIIGFISLVILIFVYLLLFNPDLSKVPEIIKDYQGMIIFGQTVFSYLLGTITHRMTQINQIGFIRNLFFKILNSTFIMSFADYKNEFHNDNFYKTEHFIKSLQFGSESVVFRITYMQSILRIFKASALLLPILGLELFFWFFFQTKLKLGVTSLAVLSLLSLSSIFSYILQFRYLLEFIKASSEIIDKYKLTLPDDPTASSNNGQHVKIMFTSRKTVSRKQY